MICILINFYFVLTQKNLKNNEWIYIEFIPYFAIFLGFINLMAIHPLIFYEEIFLKKEI